MKKLLISILLLASLASLAGTACAQTALTINRQSNNALNYGFKVNTGQSIEIAGSIFFDSGGSFTDPIASSVSSGTAPFQISSTTAVPNLNVSFLLGNTWAVPGALGSTTPNTGVFTNLGVTGVFSVSSSLQVPNLNASLLQGSTWAIPAAIGSSAPNVGTFTTANATTGNFTTVNAATGAFTTVTGSWGGTAIPNAKLANSSITIGNGGAISLGSSVSLDGITGLSSVGLVKRSAANTFVAGAAGTDYAAPTVGTSLLYGNGAGGFSNATVNAGVKFSTGTLSFDTTFSPTITGSWIFNQSSGVTDFETGLISNTETGVTGQITIAGTSAYVYAAGIEGYNATGLSKGLYITAGTNSSDYAIDALNNAANTTLFEVRGDGVISGSGFGSGLLKASGGAVSNAIAGTDYQAPLSAGQLPGTATNDNASSGNVGQFVSSTLSSGSAITASNATNQNVTSISLTAGDWDVWGVEDYSTSGVTGSSFQSYISTSSGAQDQSDAVTFGYYNISSNTNTAFLAQSISPIRISISSTTTVYLGTINLLSAGTLKVWGTIRARRAR